MTPPLPEAALRRARVRARHLVPDSPAALQASVEALAFFGEKRVGTIAGARAAAYLYDRLRGAGFEELRYEEFRFARHDVAGAALRVELGGAGPAAWTPGFDSFEDTGTGEVSAEIVHAGMGTPAEVARVELAGKIALVERNRFYHRSSQYQNLVRAGARAMIDVSAAPDNLRQVGSIRRGFERAGAIPALTVGADDGERLLAHLGAGRRARGHVIVDATTTAATGANVVGVLPGRDPAGTIVVGAHYDSWFTGATDNGAGVAALLALAERWAARERPRYTLVFCAWDGEEVALYGGYDFLRRHVVRGGAPVLAVIDLETPAALGGVFHGLAVSSCACLDHALRGAGLDRTYAGYLPMQVVPKIFGGIIPTDVQGFHRMGVPCAATATDSPWYHTLADTPEQVDARMLAAAVRGFDAALEALMQEDPWSTRGDDEELWTTRGRLEGQALVVDVVDAAGAAVAGAQVSASFLVDDFYLAAELAGVSDASGRVVLPLSAGELARGDGERWFHVEAGPAGAHARAETIVDLVGTEASADG